MKKLSDQRHVNDAPVKQGLSECPAAWKRLLVSALQLTGDHPRQRSAVRVQPRALHQHDLITDLEPSAQDWACPFGDHPHRAAGQLELVWLDQLRQRRG